MNPRYRLLHKKDGTYVLQIETLAVYTDVNGNEQCKEYEIRWKDLVTVEEE